VAISQDAEMNALRTGFAVHGQEHVFDYWAELSEPERGALLRQARRIGDGLDEFVSAHRRALAELKAGPKPASIEPAEAICLPEHGGDAQALESARERGLELLAAGRVATLVVAGGQGTRLGYPGPKGAFPVGPVSQRSLFRLQAQKISGLARRTGRSIPWYVMTSPATDAPTRALFEAEDNFGLAPEDVRIFSQGMLPAWDFDGRLILEAPGRIAESPNGHGGSLTALAQAGILEDMHTRGIDRLFYYQVDNPLVRMADPVFLGLHEAVEAEMSCKVVRKADPMEKVGVVAEIDGEPAVIEYTELSEELRYAQDAQGQLLYWAGNIAIHVFNLDFLRRIAEESTTLLPVHASAKKIESVNSAAEGRASRDPNGYKLERFVFDALPRAARTCVMEVRASEEFSPIKNADGKESPDSSRAALIACYRNWLKGVQIPPSTEAPFIEIDHSIIDSEEEAISTGITRLADAGEAILVSTGISP
jgi:UDP-N-acetylglucosamine/UDP-N-acetylgalactosamine diphosphorylase